MAFIKRIVLFLMVNVAVVLTISILMQVLGIQPYLSAYGIDYEMLAATCLVWGMGGAFISLLMSRFMAKFMMGVKVIDPVEATGDARWLVSTVHELAQQAGITVMPEVGIYSSGEVNAFATGPSKNRSLVAVSSGLLQRLRPNEAKAVLGHEMAHISNGDMVTMTLIQGVVNAFVMFLARAIAFALSQNSRREDGERGGFSPMTFYLVQNLLEIVFMLAGTIVIAAFSRWREYRADAGGAHYTGTSNMIAALEALRKTVELQDPQAAPALATLKISGRRSGFLALFSTHPPLEDRIERLKQNQFIA